MEEHLVPVAGVDNGDDVRLAGVIDDANVRDETGVEDGVEGRRVVDGLFLQPTDPSARGRAGGMCRQKINLTGSTKPR